MSVAQHVIMMIVIDDIRHRGTLEYVDDSSTLS
jgi:hypothetical protein